MANIPSDPIRLDHAPLDPDAVRVLDLIEKAGRPPYDTLTPAEAREASKLGRSAVQPDAPALPVVRELAMDLPGRRIGARLYHPVVPRTGALRPVLVYFHGGGWVIGDLESHDVLCRQLAQRSGVSVLAVDYRLAPEHPFPAAVEDAVAAVRWVRANTQVLGVDADHLAVGGDSAGGNLATVASLLCRDAGAPAIAFQLLIYPSTDLSLVQVSHAELAEQPPLTGRVMRYFRQHYLGDEDRWVDWRASPLSAPNLRGLPPAWVMTAGYDVLVDEGRDYVERLRSAGVRVDHRHYAGQFHGFVTMGRLIREADIAVTEAAAALREAILNFQPTP